MERPILFSTAMAKAILEGRKTQTRRVIKPQPEFAQIYEHKGETLYEGENRTWCYKNHISPDIWNGIEWIVQFAPYQLGDILWVRETWCNYNNKFYYKADKKCYGCTEDGICMPRGIESHITCELCESVGVDGYIRWRPSIHMPREAARIFLRVKNVRVERLQEIIPVEVVAEGMGAHECRECIATYGNPCCQDKESECGLGDEILGDFRELWDSLNAKRGYGWDTNPWVWVIEFEKQ